MVSPCYCVVCAVRLQFKIFWQCYIKKNKKNLRFHRRVYRRTITHRYFTESCKKITGLCHNHWRIYRRTITRRYFIESCKKITGLCHNHRLVYQRSYRRTIPTDLHTSRSARMSDTCPSTQIPTELPTSNTDGITDGFTHILKRTHVWHVSVCTNTDGSKSLEGFSNFFWFAFQLISDGITDGI
jgi:hypothetical protein